MKRQITLTLNQPSIEDALKQYVSDMGIIIADADVEITLTAGRGVNGHSADIIISRGSETPKPVANLQAVHEHVAGKLEEKEEPPVPYDSDVELFEEPAQESGTSLFGG